MRVEVSQDERVELQDHELMTANEAGNKPEHQELDLVLVVGLAKLGEETVSVVLRVVKGVDWKEVGTHN